MMTARALMAIFLIAGLSFCSADKGVRKGGVSRERGLQGNAGWKSMFQTLSDQIQTLNAQVNCLRNGTNYKVDSSGNLVHTDCQSGQESILGKVVGPAGSPGESFDASYLEATIEEISDHMRMDGVCLTSLATDGLNCSDGRVASIGDACNAGVCQGRDIVSTWIFTEERQPSQANAIVPRPSNLGHSGIFSMAFWIKIHSAPTGWVNVFHYGSENGDRKASVFLHPDIFNTGAQHEGLYISVSRPPNPNAWFNAGSNLTLNQYVHVALVSDESGTLTVYFDGQVEFSQPNELPVFEGSDTDPFYFSSPWYTAADVTVKNFAFANFAWNEADVQAVMAMDP